VEGRYTYVRLGEEFVFLAVMLDAYSRHVAVRDSYSSLLLISDLRPLGDRPTLVTAAQDSSERALTVVGFPESPGLHLTFAEQLVIRPARLPCLSPTNSLPEHVNKRQSLRISLSGMTLLKNAKPRESHQVTKTQPEESDSKSVSSSKTAPWKKRPFVLSETRLEEGAPRVMGPYPGSRCSVEQSRGRAVGGSYFYRRCSHYS
jgi:hypothetical protein